MPSLQSYFNALDRERTGRGGMRRTSVVAELDKKEILRLVATETRKAMRKLTAQMKEAAEWGVRVRTGSLQRSIKTRVSIDDDAMRAYVWATAPHAHLIEFGWRPRVPEKGSGGDKSFMRTLGKKAGPWPFLRPTKELATRDRFTHLMNLAKVLN